MTSQILNLFYRVNVMLSLLCRSVFYAVRFFAPREQMDLSNVVLHSRALATDKYFNLKFSKTCTTFSRQNSSIFCLIQIVECEKKLKSLTDELQCERHNGEMTRSNLQAKVKEHEKLNREEMSRAEDAMRKLEDQLQKTKRE